MAELDQRLDEYVTRAVDLLTPEQDTRLWHLKSADFMTVSIGTLSELRKQHVQGHPKLTGEQKQGVDRLYVEWLTKGEQVLREQGTDDPPRNHIAALLEPANRMEQKMRLDVQTILDERQHRRLGQLMLQWACVTDGPRVFDRPEVVERLGLAAEQRASFQRLARNVAESASDPVRGTRPVS